MYLIGIDIFWLIDKILMQMEINNNEAIGDI
jgi:hypothetical protein